MKPDFPLYGQWLEILGRQNELLLFIALLSLTSVVWITNMSFSASDRALRRTTLAGLFVFYGSLLLLNV